jgi:hypothetical protein
MDKVYQAMKVMAKSKGVKASPQHDLYKMYSPDFLNVFYWEDYDKKAQKLTMKIEYEAKCDYFDELKLYIVELDSATKITDKVRANSVIKVRSLVGEDSLDFDCDGSDEAYSGICETTFSHIEEWYQKFFTEVKDKHGDLERFFLDNKEEYPMQALLIYIRQEKYKEAEACLENIPKKSYSSRTVAPGNDEEKQRLIDSNAENLGSIYLRDDMDCIIDYITAKNRGLEWTKERARFGLLKEERG